MTQTSTRGRLSGKTVRFSFTEGPTKGSTFEHEFDADGTVTYRDAKEKGGGEKAKYGVFDVAHDVEIVSYLSKNGFTLTLALNFATDEIAGFASNDKQWFPVRGKLER